MKLPIPDSFAKAQSEKLISLIRQEIQRENSISFARFMELALYAPGLGYYSAGAHKLGAQGDFITAPELSPLFAQCIARQCQEVLMNLEAGSILELGAGSGVLARDLLLELEKLQSLPEHYYILETSADLRERQQTLLKSSCPHLFSHIIWLDQLPTEAINGIILANEVLDALPIHCFRTEEGSIYERNVTWENDTFTWKLTPPSTDELKERAGKIHQQHELADNYESEINIILPYWIKSIANTLKKGVFLIFDYGYGEREYYHPDRTHGTLMCYYQHHKHSDPFILPGLQDITAHVDFTAVVDSALAAGFSFRGYTTQASFLMACGLLQLCDTEKLSEVEAFRQNQIIKTLTLPSQMGEAIKVMALSKEIDFPLIGFSLHDRSRDL